MGDHDETYKKTKNHMDTIDCIPHTGNDILRIYENLHDRKI